MMATIIYTKSARGGKWHIQRGETPWSICGCFIAAWYISNTPGWRSDGKSEPVCKHCEHIIEAVRTGHGIPF